MKSIKYIIPVLTLTILFSTGVLAQASSEVRYKILPESKLYIDGTSTFHNFTIKAMEVNGYLVIDGLNSGASLKDEIGKIGQLKVIVPVKKLDSDKSSINENMDEALKADKNPDITFALKTISAATGQIKAGAPVSIVASGTLTIAGVSKDINMTVTGTETKDGKLLFSGEQKLLMSDYGVKPPTMFFGTVKVGDAVTVKFDLTLSDK